MTGRVAVVVLATSAMSALTGCPTVELGDTPPDIGLCRPDRDYFEQVIWPEFLAVPDIAKTCVGRSGCHAADTGRSALRLDNIEPIDFNGNYDVVTRFLNCGSPNISSLLTKPLSGIEAHGGGDLFSPGDPMVDAFQMWFQ